MSHATFIKTFIADGSSVLEHGVYIVQEHDHDIVSKRRYRKVQRTKKLGCPAHIYVQEIVKFPTFAVSMSNAMFIFFPN